MSEEVIDIPNPGSAEAKASGCTCPVQDNNHGQGIWMGAWGRQFVRNLDCPLHGGEPNIVAMRPHEQVKKI